MEPKGLIAGIALCLSSCLACSQNNTTLDPPAAETNTEKAYAVKQVTHNYGGWYCPDNLTGFPPVDLAHWSEVPVINGRMPTQEETRTEASLIFVDPEVYPSAKPLAMQLPKLARFYNEHSKKEELVIVIQALDIQGDSIVGFRYLNGGNGSARLNEVQFIAEEEVKNLVPTRFVSFTLHINATKAAVWEILTKPTYSHALQTTFDKARVLPVDWYYEAKVNFHYPKAGTITAEFAGELFGNQYIQRDYASANAQYVEKFLVLEKEGKTELQIVCGPFGDDFTEQKLILHNWAEQVKALSEGL